MMNSAVTARQLEVSACIRLPDPPPSIPLLGKYTLGSLIVGTTGQPEPLQAWCLELACHHPVLCGKICLLILLHEEHPSEEKYTAEQSLHQMITGGGTCPNLSTTILP